MCILNIIHNCDPTLQTNNLFLQVENQNTINMNGKKSNRIYLNKVQTKSNKIDYIEKEMKIEEKR